MVDRAGRRRRLDRSSRGHPGGDQLIIRDLLTNPSALRFEPFREGIEAAWLHRDPDGGPAAAVLRYQPGANAPRHRHAGWERVIVISGSQADAQGLLKAGDVALNAPGAEHEVFSEGGLRRAAHLGAPADHPRIGAAPRRLDFTGDRVE